MEISKIIVYGHYTSYDSFLLFLDNDNIRGSIIKKKKNVIF